jgi:hypothetical protein
MKTTLTDRAYFSDPEEVPKLIYDEPAGQGWIKFPKDWKKSSVVWRLDCLQDWIEILQEEYDQAHAELYREGQ